MGEALAASTDHAATFRGFAEQIGSHEADLLREALVQALRAGGEG